MITAIVAAVCGVIMLAIAANAVRWLRQPSTVDADAIEAGLSA